MMYLYMVDSCIQTVSRMGNSKAQSGAGTILRSDSVSSAKQRDDVGILIA
jgi:hypothetical protein